MTADDGLHDELSGYLDDELPADQRAELEARLAADSELADELASVAAVRAALRGLPEVEPPPGALEEVVAAVRAAEHLERRGRRARRLVGAGAMASIVAFVVAMVAVEPAVADATPDLEAALDIHAAIEQTGAVDDSAGAGLSSVHLVGRDELVHRSARPEGGTLVSMFSQPGEVDWSRMPGGERVSVAGQQAWTSVEGDDHLLVIERDGVVVTLVSGAPLVDGGSALLELVDERAPEPDDPSVWDRAEAVVSGLGDLVGIG
ncbi:MAG: hypothetical protein AAFZ07_20545 [Actinomycetota bacterium]